MNLFDDCGCNMPMQKFYNDDRTMMDDAIAGFVKAHPGELAYAGSKRALCYIGAGRETVRTGIAIGGGSGHDPAFMGFLGRNMADAVAIGDIFTPPRPEDFLAAMEAADHGAGVVCLCGNYIKDITNAETAADILRGKSVDVRIVVINDDIVEEHEGEGRRGSAGEVLAWKVAGAAASGGCSLDEVVHVTEKAVGNMYSMGVGLASCMIPTLGRPNYIIEKGTIEIGVGHHGQSSVDTMKLKPADQIVDRLLAGILDAAGVRQGPCAVMISGLGNTMLSELNILYSRTHDVLTEQGFKICKSYIGNFFTSLDMMGATLTLMMLDEELRALLDLPAFPLAFSQFQANIR